MMDGLLKLSRLETEKTPHTSVVLNDILDQAADKLRAESSAFADANMSINNMDHTVHGDAEQLITLWKIVLDNAVRYQPDGQTATIDISSTLHDQFYHISAR